MAGLKALNINTPPEAEPHIYAEDDAAIYKTIFGGDGVSTIGQACKATVLSNNKVRIADGVLCVDGHMARIPYGEYEDCEIMNGQSGKNRNDIIVAKFETTGTGGIDNMTCEAIQGIAGEMAVDPELTQDDIYAGGKVREYPLYRVKIEGLSITAVEQMFEIIPSNKDLADKLTELNKNRTYNFDSVSWTNPTYSITEKSGVIYIDYYCNPGGGVGGHSYLVATLPKNIAPNHLIRASAWAADEAGVRNAASVSIDTDGSIKIVSENRFYEAGFAASYCIN